MNSFRHENEINGARAVVVNRTHRVVREQALQMREQKEKSRSLWVPLAFFSTLMLMICYGIWASMDSYNFSPSGVPDADDQMLLFLLWSLPVIALVVGLVWYKRGRGKAGGEV